MKETKPKVKKILKLLPEKPGVYKMIDKEGRVIYVGKAKNLKKRVKSYFQNIENASLRTKKLIENIEDISYITVKTELEALVLELNLIKELHPKYNILLKDDKNFVYIKITKEDYPRVQIVRKIDSTKDTYFGPKTSKAKVEKTLRLLSKVIRFRECNLGIEDISDDSSQKIKITNETIKYPCLDYYVGKCSAPCIANITKEKYNKDIQTLKRFFEGHHSEVVKNIQDQMMEFAKNKEFEKAGRLRDKLKNIESVLERQNISDPNQEDKDIFNYIIDQDKAFFNLFQVRNGKLINQENFAVQASAISDTDDESKSELLSSFLKQYYEKTTNIPKEVLVPHDFQEKQELEGFLTEEKNKKVKILIPQKGKKNKLLELSFENAKIFADRSKTSWQTESEDKINTLNNLQILLNLKKSPKRIESYDISHFAGSDTVGSMVVFENGVPKKSDYRRFKIRRLKKEKNNIDDYKSIEEVIERRASYIGEINDQFSIRKGKQTDKKDLGIEFRNHYLITTKIETKEQICGKLMIKKHGEYERISRLEIDPTYRGERLGQRLIKYVLKRAKTKRIYINCKPSLANYYEEIGFQRVRKIPTEIKKSLSQIECAVDPSEENLWYAYDKYRLRDKSFESKPDLIVIDGGKGQLSSALKVLKKYNLNIPTISIAERKEEIFIPNSKDAIILDRTDNMLKLIQRLRNEAHRFANTFNRSLRAKTFTSKAKKI